MITANFDYVNKGKDDQFKQAEQRAELSLEPTDQVQTIFQTRPFKDWFHKNVGQFFTSIRWTAATGKYALHNDAEGVMILVTNAYGKEYQQPTSVLGCGEVNVMIWVWPSDQRTLKRELVVARLGAGKL